MKNARTHGGSTADGLVDMGLKIRNHLRQVMRNPAGLEAEVGNEGGDTIYALDRHVEPVLEAVIDSWPRHMKPLLLVCEGLGRDGTRRFGPSSGALRYRLIVDPVDGTRALMYEKRSAWFLAAVAEDNGDDTRLSQALAAALVELPPTKHGWADDFAVHAGGAVEAHRRSVVADDQLRLRVQPSQAATLKDGFCQVSSFFPGTKVLAAELMERIADRLGGKRRPGRASMFEDQYISTGGQMVELMLGHDRFTCDLRPLFDEIAAHTSGGTPGLACHPYDLAGAPVAQRAGVILTDGFGRPLDARFDVETPAHWCGYANAAIRRAVEPVVLQWLEEHGVRVLA